MSTKTISRNGPNAIDGLLTEHRRRAAAAIFTAVAMASLDTAIANIALPAIAAELRASPADAIWVVNVYQIALVATLLPLAALGEIVGHRRIYLAGLVLFTLASLACASAWSLPNPAGGTRGAGSRRQRHHECEYGASSLRLSGALARPRFRTQRAGGRGPPASRPDRRHRPS
jgi:MFS family permease